MAENSQEVTSRPFPLRTEAGNAGRTEGGHAGTSEGGRRKHYVKQPHMPVDAMVQTKPRIHQRKTRRNTTVTEHTATEPAQHGEGLRQTQIYMRSDQAELGDSSGQL